MVQRYGLKNKESEEKVILREVRISGNVCGEFVELSMSQIFENTGDKDIEGVYIFPIPDTAVITDFEANLGGRTLKARVEEKERAQEAYEAALERGDRVLSLEEIDDNVFRINIGKVLSSEKVKIKVTYIDQLIYEEENLMLVVPAILSPRHASCGEEFMEECEEQEEDYKVSLNLLVEPLSRLDIESPSHDIEVEWDEEKNLARVNLKNEETYLDEDLVLLLKERELVEASGMLYEYEGEEENKGVLYLRIIPDLEQEENEEPNHYIFLIDISETMEGEKLEEAKNALRLCIRNLSEGDTFNIIAAEAENHLFSKSGKVPFNQENLQLASDWIDNLEVKEDAEIFEALKYCLSEKSENGIGTILIFTDDEGEQDEEIIEYVRENIKDNRIFPFGIDSSASSYLINKLAEVGHGRPEFIYQGERIDDMVIRQFSRIENPQIDVTEINWGSMKVERTYPRTISYLYNNEPFSIFATVAGEIEGKITLKGMVYDKPYEKVINLDVLDLEENADLVQKVWMRKRIESIEERLRGEKGQVAQAMKDKIIELSQESGIISTYTSFVMVEQVEEPLLGMVMSHIIPMEISEEALKNITEAYFIESPSFIYKSLYNGRTAVKQDKSSESNKYRRDNILRTLARNQFADGAFANYHDKDEDIVLETTSAAVLAFTLGKEDLSLYSNQILKSVKFIVKTLEEKTVSERTKELAILALKSAADRNLAKGGFKQAIGEKYTSSLSGINIKEKVAALLELVDEDDIIERAIMEEKFAINTLAKLAILRALK